MKVLYFTATSLVVSVGAAAALADTFGYHDKSFCEPQRGDIKDALGACFESSDKVNAELRPLLQNLVATDYFRYYKVDLSGKGCPFVEDDGMCGNRACAVDTIEDDSELPEYWRSQYLGMLAEDSIQSEQDVDLDDEISDSCLNDDASVTSQRGCLNGGCSSSEKIDYCYPEDESRDSDGVYVSLTDNPERYTGYAGAHANKVWRAAYLENCFGYYGDAVAEHPEVDSSFSEPSSSQGVFGGASSSSQRGAQLSAVLHDSSRHDIQEVGGEQGDNAMNEADICAEQRLFYRLISGMHSSVSTHLCYDSLNKTTGEWGPNLDCFMARVGNHPERVQNLYFDYALVQRAVAKLKDYIGYLYFCREDPDSDYSTRNQLLKLTEAAAGGSNGDKSHLFNESRVFATPETQPIKDEFRKRMRNVNQMMSCVGCDRCRLWGKLQTQGYGTALKVLLELPEKPSDNHTLTKKILSTFKRTELVSLINVFDRLSKSVEAVNYFRGEVQKEYQYNQKPQASEWDPEWALAWDGIKFILQSYIDFPKNLWYIFIEYADKYWNKFIGRDNTKPYYVDL